MEVPGGIMSDNMKHSLLMAGQMAAYAVAGGIVIHILPFLQHWAVYVVWGPILGGVLVWACSFDRDVRTDEWKRDFLGALIVGITHLVAVTAVWSAVTKGLV
jgi:hypothetical protein